VINAENTTGLLQQSLCGANLGLIRAVYRDVYDPSSLSDKDAETFLYMQCLHLHVSRICLMLQGAAPLVHLDHGRHVDRSWRIGPCHLMAWGGVAADMVGCVGL
jgi:hypothetical protein